MELFLFVIEIGSPLHHYPAKFCFATWVSVTAVLYKPKGQVGLLTTAFVNLFTLLYLHIFFFCVFIQVILTVTQKYPSPIW
jgi:hypothetical protein